MRKRIWIPEYSTDGLDKPVVSEVRCQMPSPTLAGIFHVELIEAATGRIKEQHSFPNIIQVRALDLFGMHNIGGTTRLGNLLDDELIIGTGSTTPTSNDHFLYNGSMEEPIANTDSNGGFATTVGYVTGSPHGPFLLGDPYHFTKVVRVFVEAEGNTGSISEMGFAGTGSQGAGLLNRALLKDSSGTPITITKQDTDQLKVTYEMRMYPPTFHSSGSFVMVSSSVSHSWTASAVDIDNADVWGFTAGGFGVQGFFRGLGVWSFGFIGRTGQPFASGAIPKNPTGTVTDWGWSGNQDNAGSPFASQSLPTYVCGSFTKEREETWGPALANFASGGIQAFAFTYTTTPFAFGMFITPSIKKTDTQELKLTHTVFYSASVTSST